MQSRDLKEYLKGAALFVVDGFSLTDAHYSVAQELLRKRYVRPYMVVDSVKLL